MAEYIERDKAIDACFDGWNNNAHDCAENIRLIPAADVVPVRHGRWMGHDIGNGTLSIDEDTCSLCGSCFYQIAETGCDWNYCPHCGADMREES